MIDNYMEIFVKDIYDEVIKGYPSFCNCKVCKEDVICMALNKLPPMYNTTPMGQVYGKLTEIKIQFRVQVILELGKAIEKVSKNPRHSA